MFFVLGYCGYGKWFVPCGWFLEFYWFLKVNFFMYRPVFLYGAFTFWGNKFAGVNFLFTFV